MTNFKVASKVAKSVPGRVVKSPPPNALTVILENRYTNGNLASPPGGERSGEVES
jgi:hypothetical protein